MSNLQKLMDEAITSLRAYEEEINAQRAAILASTDKALDAGLTGPVDIGTRQIIFNKINEAFAHETHTPEFFAIISEAQEMMKEAMGLNNPDIIALFGEVDTIN